MRYPVPTIDSRLMNAIRDGNCVAFIGAGFSAAAGLPQWKDLIQKVAISSDPASRSRERDMVLSLLNARPGPSSRELEMAAQLLFDELGEAVFCERLSQSLHEKDVPETMQLRLKHLRGIPFRAIVTTNCDPLVPGLPPSAETYRKLLRPRRPFSPWREAITRVALGEDPLFKTTDDADAVVVQLHGRLDDARSLVLTRSQYRHRLYADPAYLTALRSLLATSTVLFLGYSLTDAYLNELRSELVEAFSSTDGPAEPIAWAVIEGVSDVACHYYERHEGLGVVPYHAQGQDHRGFDAILKAIFAETNSVHRLGKLLCGRRILWFDPHPDHNDLGRELLRAAVKVWGEDRDEFDQRLVETQSLEATWSKLTNGDAFDLVISHWGHGLSGGRPNGAELLRRMAEQRAKGCAMPPVIIFASGNHAASNRRHALHLGAAEFVSRWDDLIAMTERLLAAVY